MSDSITVNGWELSLLGGDSERRILDVDLGARLGYADPMKVQRVIEGLVADGEMPGILRADRTVASGNLRGHGPQERTVKAYYLTEREALQVIAKSRTKMAHKITNEVIDVYLVVKNGDGKLDADARAIADLREKVSVLSEQHLALMRHIGSSRFGLLEAGADAMRARIRALRDAYIREGVERDSVRVVQGIVEMRIRREIGYPCGAWEACPPEKANAAHSYLHREFDALERRARRREKSKRRKLQTHLNLV